MARYSQSMKSIISESIRNSIRESGIALIREHGWSAFTTERIAERAGVSRGVLYNYFDNKEDIAHFIIEDSIEQTLSKMKIAAERDELTAVERLILMCVENVSDFVSQRELHKTFMENIPPPAKSKHSPPKAFMERDRLFISVLEYGIDNNEFTPDLNINSAVIMITGTLHELCIRSIFNDTTPDTESVCRLFLRGITK